MKRSKGGVEEQYGFSALGSSGSPKTTSNNRPWGGGRCEGGVNDSISKVGNRTHSTHYTIVVVGAASLAICHILCVTPISL